MKKNEYKSDINELLHEPVITYKTISKMLDITQ